MKLAFIRFFIYNRLVYNMLILIFLLEGKAKSLKMSPANASENSNFM
jgi:hypothetical protein